MSPVQTDVEQSDATRQLLPGVQPAQVPPQSTSVSLPFWTRSLQPGWVQTPDEQNVVTQSAPVRHVCPSAQTAHVPPPQSTSVSAPFSTLSLHVEAWHTLAVQTPLVQSPPTSQAAPGRQSGQDVPPQSTSLSLPLRMVSVQLGA
jgi:hypothetical protein